MQFWPIHQSQMLPMLLSVVVSCLVRLVYRNSELSSLLCHLSDASVSSTCSCLPCSLTSSKISSYRLNVFKISLFTFSISGPLCNCCPCIKALHGLAQLSCWLNPTRINLSSSGSTAHSNLPKKDMWFLLPQEGFFFHAFWYADLHLWKSLPQPEWTPLSFFSICKHLKTYLFSATHQCRP